jgi:Mg2+ and Co2+ transporter CorA
MPDDAEAAQARALLDELHEHVEKVSRKIEIVERRNGRRSVRGIAHVHRQHSELRRDLYEARRLIDGLHRRYPETRICERPQQALALD